MYRPNPRPAAVANLTLSWCRHHAGMAPLTCTPNPPVDTTWFVELIGLAAHLAHEQRRLDVSAVAKEHPIALVVVGAVEAQTGDEVRDLIDARRAGEIRRRVFDGQRELDVLFESFGPADLWLTKQRNRVEPLEVQAIGFRFGVGEGRPRLPDQDRSPLPERVSEPIGAIAAGEVPLDERAQGPDRRRRAEIDAETARAG